MLKSIAPIWLNLRHLPRPHMFTTHGQSVADADDTTLGQRLAERAAAGIGSWTFLILQSGFLVLWLVYNTLQFTTRFDPPPYILLNLLLSFQAAFTGPVLLIAANVGALRDHKQSDRIEQLARQNQDLSQQNEKLVERMIAVEQLLDDHIAASLQAHTTELRELGALVRAVHTAVTNGNGATPQ